MNKLYSGENQSRNISISIVVIAYILLEILMRSGNLSSLFTSLLMPTCCYIVAAIGLNLNVGISGELSLGQAGFMSVGAFTAVCVSGSLSVAFGIESDVPRLILSIIGGILVSSLFGWLIGIPTLKLSGDYLAIVTLAFGEIIKSLITNMYLGVDANGYQFSFVQNKVSLEKGGKMLLNGAMGATGTDRISTFTAGIIVIILTLFIIYNLLNSKNGRAIMATRDNRIAASSVGINVTSVKMLAFVISAGLAGAAGALYGLNYATLVPSKFDFNLSIMILVYVVMGGLGNMTGTIISTTILVLLPQLLRSLSDYRMLIYSIVLIAMMLITNNEKIKTLRERFRVARRTKPGKNEKPAG